jgi:hypothetical protein
MLLVFRVNFLGHGGEKVASLGFGEGTPLWRWDTISWVTR